MPPRTPLRTAVRWMFTLAALLFLAAFLFSLGRCPSGDSPGLNYQVGLWRGVVWVAWRPVGYDAHADPYRGTPGWSMAGYGGDYPVQWWFSNNTQKSYTGFSTPHWVPALLAGIVAWVCWRRERRLLATRWQSFTHRLAPRAPIRLGVVRIVVFCLLHFGVSIAVLATLDILVHFYAVQHPSIFEERHNEPGWYIFISQFFSPLLLIGTPVWGAFWAWLWVAWMNALRECERPNTCTSCGYDLTGNISGRCPECGATRSPAPS